MAGGGHLFVGMLLTPAQNPCVYAAFLNIVCIEAPQRSKWKETRQWDVTSGCLEVTTNHEWCEYFGIKDGHHFYCACVMMIAST